VFRSIVASVASFLDADDQLTTHPYFAFCACQGLFHNKDTDRQKTLEIILDHSISITHPLASFAVLVYRLQVESSPVIQWYILNEGLPRLLSQSQNDPIVTGKAYQIIHSLLDREHFTLYAVALRAIWSMTQVQPRLWPYLVAAMQNICIAASDRVMQSEIYLSIFVLLRLRRDDNPKYIDN
jgi:hypothetical protein